MIRLMIILLAVAVLSTFTNAALVVRDPLLVSCTTKSKAAVYGIKTIHVWFESEDKIKVTYDDLYGMDDIFFRDEREFQDEDGGSGDYTSYHISSPDMTKYPEGPLSPLKLEKKMLEKLFDDKVESPKTSGDVYAAAAKMRRERIKASKLKVRGKLILKGRLGRDVTYSCLQM